MHPSKKKTPPVEKRGFQSRPGLAGRHHSRSLNTPSGGWFLAIAGFPAEAGNADKAKERRNIDERFDPLHARNNAVGDASFPSCWDQVRGVWQIRGGRGAG